MGFNDFLSLLRDAGKRWSDAKAPRLGASLAFYAAISLAPMLSLLIAIVAIAFGPQAAAGDVADQVQATAGRPVADAIREMASQAGDPWTGTLATLGSLAVLLFGASGVFGELQDSLNTIWEVKPRPGSGLLDFVRARFLSILAVLGSGFLLIISLVVSTVLAALSRMWATSSPGGALLWQIVNAGVALAVVTLLFALIFKVLPDVRVRWADVWVGAIATALLFNVGQQALALYLAHGGVSTGYGAASSLIVLLLWVYYSAQIMLFGASITRVWSQRYGKDVQPAANAVRLGTPAPDRHNVSV